MSEIDVRAAALAHLRSLPRDRLSLVTMRQLKRGLEGDLKLTEGSIDDCCFRFFRFFVMFVPDIGQFVFVYLLYA